MFIWSSVQSLFYSSVSISVTFLPFPPLSFNPLRAAHSSKIYTLIMTSRPCTSDSWLPFLLGAHEIRSMLQQDISSFAEHHTVQTRLDDFYMSRIGIRMVHNSPSLQDTLVCCLSFYFSVFHNTTITSTWPNFNPFTFILQLIGQYLALRKPVKGSNMIGEWVTERQWVVRNESEWVKGLSVLRKGGRGSVWTNERGECLTDRLKECLSTREST